MESNRFMMSNTEKDRTNLLSGLRVIDCGTYIAGPATAMAEAACKNCLRCMIPSLGSPFGRYSYLQAPGQWTKIAA